jgi:hypothetical protein
VAHCWLDDSRSQGSSAKAEAWYHYLPLPSRLRSRCDCVGGASGGYGTPRPRLEARCRYFSASTALSEGFGKIEASQFILSSSSSRLYRMYISKKEKEKNQNMLRTPSWARKEKKEYNIESESSQSRIARPCTANITKGK